MNRTKRYAKGKVWSIKLQRYVHTYDNDGDVDPFQEGTIGEKELPIIPVEPDSADCSELTKYYSKELRQTFRPACGEGFASYAQEITYVVEAGKHWSYTSQLDADNKALLDMKYNGETWANENKVCIKVYLSPYRSGTYIKNDCPEGTVGSSKHFELLEGAIISTISQEDADAKAEEWVRTQWQALTNYEGTCTIVYRNDYMVVTKHKNDCATGYSGTAILYEVPAGKYTSPTSKAEANAKAQADIDANSQNFANSMGVCEFIPIYYNTEMRKSAIRDNCAGGQSGTEVVYIVPAGKYSSLVSVEVANITALADLNLNAQTYANSAGVCLTTVVYYNSTKSKTFIKNDCGGGDIGEAVVYTVASGTYSSTVSQSAADALAQADIDANGQDYANTEGTCISTTVYYNVMLSESVTRNNCSDTTAPQTITYTVEEGKYSSTVSQAAADALAAADMAANKQAYANTFAECKRIYKSFAKAVGTKRNNCVVGEGSEVVLSTEFGQFTSLTSQADADNQATAWLEANRQAHANANGTCPIIYKSKGRSITVAKSDCGPDSRGSAVVFTTAAEMFTSTISQEHADSLAANYEALNKQSYANINGTCTLLYYSAMISGSIQKTDCALGVGTYVDFIVPYGEFTSSVSQSEADGKALAYFNENKQLYANTSGSCIITYKSKPLSETVLRDNCGAGYTTQAVVYSVPGGMFTSNISQEDADLKAISYANINKQTYANANGVCDLIVTYYNAAVSRTLSRNNCGSGTNGSSVTYTVAYGTYTSTVSQAHADQLAALDLNANAQAYANSTGTCSVTSLFYNAAISETVTRNNCGPNTDPQSITYVVPYGKYTSSVSQAAADALALADMNANKQTWANTYATCTRYWLSKLITLSVARNNCNSDEVGGTITVTNVAGKFISYISQEDADNKSIADFNARYQQVANETAVCKRLYRSKPITGVVSKDNCGVGTRPVSVTFTVPEGMFTSEVSQDNADGQAVAYFNANKQSYANTNDVCIPDVTYYNASISKTLLRNNCASGSVGSSVTYTVASATYSSTVSQEDADAKALRDIEENAQNFANAGGTCSVPTLYYSKYLSKTLFRTDCGPFTEPQSQTYIVPYGKYTSSVSQAAADALAQADLDTNAQTYVNTYAKCSIIYRSKLITETVVRDNCYGATPSSVTVTNPEGKFTSTVSQEDADFKSLKDFNSRKQAYANTVGTCAITYYSKAISTTVSRSNCGPGYTTEPVQVNVEYGRFTSEVSQLDADNQAVAWLEANKQLYANTLGICTLIPLYYNVMKSITLTRNNCGTGSTGSSYTYVVPARKYSSTTSQADADAQADADIAANGQYQANLNGTCSVNCNISATFTVVRNGSSDVSITVNPVGGTAPYTYLWSNGAITKSISVPPNAEYSVIVKDAKGCLYTDKVKPSFKISGIQIEVMYFKNNTANTADPFYPRIVYGNHECFRARFEVFANNTSLGIANMNNLTPSLDFGEWAKNDKNTPPEPYDNPDPGVTTGGIWSGNRDRYWKKVITSSEAEALVKARVDGKIDITLKWTGENNSINVPVHSDQNWIRIKDSTGKVLLSTTTKAFTNLIFDPFA